MRFRACQRVKALTALTKLIPAFTVVIATVAPVPVAFGHVVGIVAILVVHQGAVGAHIKLWIQACTFVTMPVPVRTLVVAAIPPIPIAFKFVV